MNHCPQALMLTRQIMQELSATARIQPTRLAIPVGISNRHLHLSLADMETLFGYGATLTRMKAVKQPGQFAADQTVTLHGPKGDIAGVRVLGPLRTTTQIEISIADSFVLGVKAPVRMSGELQESAGIEILGPRGRVQAKRGTIVAWRHLHISPQQAAQHKLSDGMEIDIEAAGPRGGIMRHVRVRVSEDAVLELHIDREEANGFGLHNGDIVHRWQQAC